MARRLAGWILMSCLTVLIDDPALAASLWTGPPIAFSKASFADPTLPANQDRITGSIFLTRGSNQGLYNAALETAYVQGSSPANTEWAPGRIADGIENLTFSEWRTAVNANPAGAVGVPYVLHILDDDLYVDLTLTSWGIGGTSGPGGAFAYIRSTPSAEPVPLAAPMVLISGLLGLVAAGLRWLPEPPGRA